MSGAAATAVPPALLGVGVLLRSLKLPGFVRTHADVARRAEREGWSFEQYLHHLAEVEVEERRARRIERLLHDSDLPHDKTLATLDLSRLSASVRRSVPTLCEGGFVDRAENLLAATAGALRRSLVCSYLQR